MFVSSHIFLVTMPFNTKFRCIINMQGCGATKAANGLNITISEFTERQINIEMVVGDNNFEKLRE